MLENKTQEGFSLLVWEAQISVTFRYLQMKVRSIVWDLKIQEKKENGNYLGYPVKYILMFSV